MAENYYATKDLTIDGRVIPKGQDLPAGLPEERVQAGLRSGSIARRREPATALPPARPTGEATPAAPAARARGAGGGR